MDTFYWWWIAAGLAVAAELLTGTFYLLMFALGLVAAALLAMVDASLAHQLLTAAIVGGGAVALWHWRRGAHRASAPSPQVNPDLLLDIGQNVHVTHWRADGTARVQYRGAEWSARHEAGAGASLHSGEFVIRAIEGSELVLGTR